MEENQGAEQTLHGLLPDQLDSSSLAKCSLGDKGARGQGEAIKGSPKHAGQKIHHL